MDSKPIRQTRTHRQGNERGTMQACMNEWLMFLYDHFLAGTEEEEHTFNTKLEDNFDKSEVSCKFMKAITIIVITSFINGGDFCYEGRHV